MIFVILNHSKVNVVDPNSISVAGNKEFGHNSFGVCRLFLNTLEFNKVVCHPFFVTLKMKQCKTLRGILCLLPSNANKTATA